LKKFSIIALSFLLLMSFTAIAYAIHVPGLPEGESVVVSKDTSITLGGRILVRGWYFDNVEWGAGEWEPEDSNSIALYTTNLYLYVDAKITDNLQAYMELETCNNSTGTSGLYVWGSNDAKPDANLFFRQAWIQYTGSGLLGVPSGIKVGHQLLTIGEKQFLNLERFGTDAIVVFTNPVKELHIAALTAKIEEGDGVPGRQTFTDNTDDLDAYIVLGTYKLDKDNTIGANYTFLNLPDADLSFSNIGLHANGLLMGALSYAAELDFQFGEIDDPGEDIGGWGIMAKAAYKLDPVNLRASFAYGSGDDDAGDVDSEEFQVIMGNDDVSPLARFVHYTQIFERTIRTAAHDQLGTVDGRSTGIANTTYYNLGLDYMPMKDLSLSLDGFYLLATETDSWGSDVDDNLGWEIDFKGSYKITKNLSYFMELGWFDAGDFYKSSGLVDSDELESVTQIVHGLNLTF